MTDTDFTPEDPDGHEGPADEGWEDQDWGSRADEDDQFPDDAYRHDDDPDAYSHDGFGVEDSPQPVRMSEADLSGLMSFFGELATRLRTPAAPPPEREEKPPPELQYENSIEWFEKWCRHVYRRRLPGRGASPAWDAEWWKDNEARARIDSIWRAWEKLRLDPATGMSVWFRDHGDYHMGILMGEAGPFATERSPRRDLGEPLPHLPWDQAFGPVDEGITLHDVPA